MWKDENSNQKRQGSDQKKGNKEKTGSTANSKTTTGYYISD